MPSSQAHVSTASASRYLQQVCKHWSHKFAVEFTPEKGHIPFSDGRICNLEATPTCSRCEPKRPMWKHWNGCSVWSWSTSSDLPSGRISARSSGRQRIKTLDVSLTAPLHRGQGSAVMAAASVPTSSSIVG